MNSKDSGLIVTHHRDRPLKDDADFLKQLLSDPEVAKHFKKGELESICTTDFHYKHIESRFKKLGL